MARPKRGETLSLTIDDLAFGGEGVGRADGYVVFVPGGVPGDRLRVRLVQARSRFGRGVIEAVEEPSPQRVQAPCPYFGRCGGCRLQHMAYPAQLAFKAKQVVDALERLGGLKGVEVRPDPRRDRDLRLPEQDGVHGGAARSAKEPRRGGAPRGRSLRLGARHRPLPAPVRPHERPARRGARASSSSAASPSTSRRAARGCCAS